MKVILKVRLIVTIFGIALLLGINISWEILFAKNRTVNLTILYSSNPEGEIRSCGCPKDEDYGGLGRRTTYVNSTRETQSNSLLFEVGDVFGDANTQSNLKAEVAMKAMKQMKYDAMTLGEREFTFGRSYVEEQMRNLGFPIISANIVDETTGKLFAPQPYIIKEMPNGLRVGIIGVLSDKFQLPPSRENQQLRILPPTEALQRYLPELKAKSDLVIILSHLGIFDSVNLARAVNGIDVIISGHGGHGIEKPFVINDTIIVQTGNQGKYLGRLDLRFDEMGKIVSYQNQLIPLERKYKEHPAIGKLFDEYNEKVKQWQKSLPVEVSIRQVFATSEACQSCHPSQYKSWQQSAHARAFETLQKRNQEYDPECVGCHTLGYKQFGGFIRADVTPELTDVQCESCHGPGLAHAQKQTKGYGQISIASCRPCHNQKHSPTFDFPKYLAKLKCSAK
ncbi:hypothetical protein H8E77_23880 [bacterium]|nr:hypothetical protein [bacterium]